MERELALALPFGTRLLDLALVASNGLHLFPDSSVVNASNGGFAVIANSGDEATELGPEVKTGSVWSKSSVALRPRSRVTGFVKTGGTIDASPDAVITGATETGATLTPVRPFTWKVDFESGSVDVTVKNGEDNSLPPGTFRNVDVKPGGKLRLAAGSYYLASLRVGHGATLIADTQADPILVYVNSDLDSRGSVGAGGDRFFIGYLGNATARLRGTFAGTVVAPYGTLLLQDHGAYTGSFFARDIEVHPHALVSFKPFAAWEFIFPPKPIIECVSEFNPTAYNVLFGYENPLDIDVTIPIGPRNHVDPTTAGSPPTSFRPGRVVGVFTTKLPESGTSWQIGREVARATRSLQPRCTGAEYLNVPRSVPPNILCVESPSPVDPKALERLRTGRP